jgi:alkanesulfonate monooxygenase SsuD/methylene tetrahydromethanopterin reductase-like flavin-dependent oxidoreductase (luciferase family)
VTALWDSWEDDAFLRDKESGRFYDTGKVHDINHKGEHFSIKGPLNVPRPVQGHPVVVQAGQSEDGRKLAAYSAEVIFTAHQNLASAQEFYRDIRSASGRWPQSRPCADHAGCRAVVGRTEAEAREKYQRLNDLILPEDGVALLNGLPGRPSISRDIRSMGRCRRVPKRKG